MDERAQFVVCQLQSWGRPAVLSTTATCLDCLRGVWISVTMAPRLNEGLDPLCIPCSRIRAARAGGVEAQLDERQTGELAGLGILGFARRFVDHVNRGGKF